MVLTHFNTIYKRFTFDRPIFCSRHAIGRKLSAVCTPIDNMSVGMGRLVGLIIELLYYDTTVGSGRTLVVPY